MTEDESTFYKKLGHNVALLRKQHDLTQAELANILGVSQQHMASFEVGRRKITSFQLPALAELFSVTTDDLLGLNVKKSSKPGPASTLQQQFEQVQFLPRSKQKFVIEMLANIIKPSS